MVKGIVVGRGRRRRVRREDFVNKNGERNKT
jgi:hypothetical protein